MVGPKHLWRGAAACFLGVALVTSGAIVRAQSRTVGAHHIDHAAGAPAFEVDNLGIFSFRLLIGGDGSVQVLRSGPRSTPCVRLLDPKAQLSAPTLDGLLKLAEAERFFSMPTVLHTSGRNVDLISQSITIHTTAGTKTVVMQPPATNKRFNELHAVIRAAAGFTFRCS